MSVVTIYTERLPFHPLLGRNIRLDSRSLDYAVQPVGVTVTSIRHAQSIDVLDQGQVGSCTGNASCSCAYHAPFYAPGAPDWSYAPSEVGARSWYHQNTVEDGYQGTWNVDGTGDDTGSDGLTSSKVAKEAGIVSGYRAALDLDSSLQALMTAPGITGIPFYNSMFDAGSDGLMTVTASSGLAGGHELCVDEIVAADALGNGTGKLLVGGPNSWGTSWGAQGRWYLTGDDWWSLRKQDGDVYFWVPNSQPAPTPTPTPTPTPVPPNPGPAGSDEELWQAAQPFITQHHVVPSYKKLTAEFLSWGAGQGFTR
jgi:hypothetical protein